MKIVVPQLYVGTVDDYNFLCADENWYTVSLAKEPLHRQMVGYTGRACDKSNSEYLYAIRENGIFCNLVDVDDVNYISKIIIDEAVNHAIEMIKQGKNVLVCCNKAESRSPVVVILIMKKLGLFHDITFRYAETKFSEEYKEYNPKKGIREYAIIHWDEY